MADGLPMSPTGPHLVTPTDGTRPRAAHTELVHLRTRVRQLERVIRALLWSPSLTRQQRTDLIYALGGKRPGTGKPEPFGLTAGEHQLVTHYRAMRPQHMRMLSLFAKQFAEFAQEKKGGT